MDSLDLHVAKLCFVEPLTTWDFPQIRSPSAVDSNTLEYGHRTTCDAPSFLSFGVGGNFGRPLL